MDVQLSATFILIPAGDIRGFPPPPFSLPFQTSLIALLKLTFSGLSFITSVWFYFPSSLGVVYFPCLYVSVLSILFLPRTWLDFPVAITGSWGPFTTRRRFKWQTTFPVSLIWRASRHFVAAESHKWAVVPAFMLGNHFFCPSIRRNNFQISMDSCSQKYEKNQSSLAAVLLWKARKTSQSYSLFVNQRILSSPTFTYLFQPTITIQNPQKHKTGFLSQNGRIL